MALTVRTCGLRLMPSAVERAPADFLVDVADPANIEAERLVLAYLRNVRRWPCLDRRERCQGWDFEVSPGGGAMWRLDVKADSYIDSTMRGPFEGRHVYRGGAVKDGWGRNPSLDLVAVVGTSSWRCWFVRVPVLRAMVDRCAATDLMPKGWVPFRRDNLRGGYVTEGWAVPLEDLMRGMAILHVAQLPDGKP